MKQFYLFLMLMLASVAKAEDSFMYLRAELSRTKNNFCKFTNSVFGKEFCSNKDPRRVLLWISKGRVFVPQAEIDQIDEDQFRAMYVVLFKKMGEKEALSKGDSAVISLRMFLAQQAEKEKNRIELGLDETESDNDGFKCSAGRLPSEEKEGLKGRIVK